MARNTQKEEKENKSTVTITALESVSISGVFIKEGATAEIEKEVFETLVKQKNPILRLIKQK